MYCSDILLHCIIHSSNNSFMFLCFYFKYNIFFVNIWKIISRMSLIFGVLHYNSTSKTVVFCNICWYMLDVSHFRIVQGSFDMLWYVFHSINIDLLHVFTLIFLDYIFLRIFSFLSFDQKMCFFHHLDKLIHKNINNYYYKMIKLV